MPHRAFIGLGTNLGDRAANYREAVQRIAALPTTRVTRQSSIYETEPVGDIKGAFINGVVEVETELAPDAMMRRMLGIERMMGRKRVRGKKPASSRAKYRPRIIDLDLLFFDNEIIDTRTLKVPHPRLHERRFALESREFVFLRGEVGLGFRLVGGATKQGKTARSTITAAESDATQPQHEAHPIFSAIHPGPIRGDRTRCVMGDHQGINRDRRAPVCVSRRGLSAIAAGHQARTQRVDERRQDQ